MLEDVGLGLSLFHNPYCHPILSNIVAPRMLDVFEQALKNNGKKRQFIAMEQISTDIDTPVFVTSSFAKV
jgi:hypothetical protein